MNKCRSVNPVIKPKQVWRPVVVSTQKDTSLDEGVEVAVNTAAGLDVLDRISVQEDASSSMDATKLHEDSFIPV